MFQDTPPATRQAEIVRKEGVRVIMQYENRTRLHMPTVRGVMDDMRRVAYTLGAPFYGYASGGAQIWEWFVAAAAPHSLGPIPHCACRDVEPKRVQGRVPTLA